jgi:putative DNA primase/helicase
MNDIHDDWHQAGAEFRARLDAEARGHREQREARRRRRAKPGPEPNTGDVRILSSSTPLDSARELIRCHYTRDSRRTLHHQQGAFYRWSGSHYVEATQEGMRSEVYEFLDGAQTKAGSGTVVPFKPNKANVGNVLDALAAVSQLPDRTGAPTWLDHNPHLAASEILAFSNGLALAKPTAVAPFAGLLQPKRS